MTSTLICYALKTHAGRAMTAKRWTCGLRACCCLLCWLVCSLLKPRTTTSTTRQACMTFGCSRSRPRGTLCIEYVHLLVCVFTYAHIGCSRSTPRGMLCIEYVHLLVCVFSIYICPHCLWIIFSSKGLKVLYFFMSTSVRRRDLPNNGTAVMRLSPELKDLLDKMFEVHQVIALSFSRTCSHAHKLCSLRLQQTAYGWPKPQIQNRRHICMGRCCTCCCANILDTSVQIY